MLKDTEVKETISGITVEMRSVTEEAKQMVTTQLNDTIPIMSAVKLPADAVIFVDQDQDDDWLDDIIVKLANGPEERTQGIMWNANRSFESDNQVAVYHSSDQFLSEEKKTEATTAKQENPRKQAEEFKEREKNPQKTYKAKPEEMYPTDPKKMRQYVTIFPNKTDKKKCHLLIVAASYGTPMDMKKKRGRVYLTTPNETERADLFVASKQMAAQTRATILSPEIKALKEKLTHSLKPINAVPSIEPFANTGAWAILFGSLYFSEKHNSWFYLNWNIPLPIKTEAQNSGIQKFCQFAEEVLERYLQEPDVIAYLDEVVKQDCSKPAIQLPKPLATLQSRMAIDAAIKLMKDPTNAVFQKEYNEIYHLLKDVVPMKDLVSIMNSYKVASKFTSEAEIKEVSVTDKDMFATDITLFQKVGTKRAREESEASEVTHTHRSYLI